MLSGSSARGTFRLLRPLILAPFLFFELLRKRSFDEGPLGERYFIPIAPPAILEDEELFHLIVDFALDCQAHVSGIYRGHFAHLCCLGVYALYILNCVFCQPTRSRKK